MSIESNCPPLRILHLEDSKVDHELACMALRRASLNFLIERVETLHDFDEALARRPDIVLADYQLPGFTALDAWQQVVKAGLAGRIPVVLLSGAIGEAAAVQAIQQGIADYLLKDSMAKLAHTVSRALEVSQARREREQASLELAASERRLAELAEHLQSSIEQERAAIAREIHDDIGGALTAVKFDLAWLSRHSPDEASSAHLRAATDMLQHALGASQRIMLNLRPPILDQGLVPALQWLADSFSRRTGIPARLQVRMARSEASRDIQLVAYRTAQEALTNITKYADCSRVEMDISEDSSALTLEIADNGRGIDPAELAKPRSFGLKGLKERARMAGGWLDVSSQPGRGTAITLTVPMTSTTPPALPSEEETP
ncbi:histidine kinase [Curvibacter sp. RS43]|uniref:Oxygen sensor histidine kinase NreB n=1 Tax=Curvibacter microcysteis TaxID=3026419 RepID=A0ABT5MJ67_9BURK|nr:MULTISPECIES: ATP-binding protein [unclassified Curvibacter]MDD0811842.1 histidine kinase [Curvibacter sp. RS43]MDD0816607.1 histidine kinase [Curvibacter sp. HBC28]